VPIEPKPGEVWFAELGMVEKSRPVLVLAFPDNGDARALAVVAPLTSQIRGCAVKSISANPDGFPSTPP
jgi:mRNA-degrading endonuclease toxin of MazEF toxin-antitoxin module